MGPGALTTVLLKVDSQECQYSLASGANVAVAVQMSPLKLCVLGLPVHTQDGNDRNLHEESVWCVGSHNTLSQTLTHPSYSKGHCCIFQGPGGGRRHCDRCPLFLRPILAQGLESLACSYLSSCLLSTLQLDLKSVAVFFLSVSGLKDLNILKPNQTLFLFCWASQREES